MRHEEGVFQWDDNDDDFDNDDADDFGIADNDNNEENRYSNSDNAVVTEEKVECCERLKAGP